MKRILFACAVVLVVTGDALASVNRVVVTKETQSKSGIELSLTVEPVRGLDDKPRSDGYSRFTLSVPGKQKPLEHLWRTELWIQEKEKGPMVLSVAVALFQKPAGEMAGEFSLSSRLLEHATLAFRCGKNAPLAETVYQVRLKTYLRNTTSRSQPAAAPSRESTVAGLRMSISAVSPQEPDKSPAFRVSIENPGNKDAVLNLGTMLTNGTVQRPDAIRLVLIHPQSKELHWRDSRAGVGGRLDDYVVPLRVGSIYSMKLSLDNYWCPGTKEWRMELEPGNYRIYAKFEGKGAVSLNRDTEGIKLMPFWKGQLQSNVATFSVTEGS